MFSRKYILLIIIIIFIACDDYFLFHNITIQSWDQSYHLDQALYMYDAVKYNNYFSLLHLNSIYPPVFYISTLPLLFINKYPPFPILINNAYLIILALSVYILSCHFFNRLAGIISVISILSMPILFYLRQNYLLDFSLTAMVTLSMMIFIKSRGLSRPFYILVPIVTALTVLTKGYGLLYIMPFYLFYSIYFSKISARRGVMSMLIFLGLILIWVIPNKEALLDGFKNIFLYGEVEKDPQGFIPSFAYYLQAMLINIGISMTVITIFAASFLMMEKMKRKILYVLFLSLIMTLLIFTFIPNKDERYITVFTVYISMLIGGGIAAINNNLLQKILIGSICLLGLLSIMAMDFGKNALIFDPAYDNHHEKNDWAIPKIMVGLKKRLNKPTNISLMADHPFINGNTYNYYAHLYNVPIRVYGQPTITPGIEDFISQTNFTEYILKVDNVTEFKNQTPIYDYLLSTYAYFDSVKNRYILLETYHLSNGIHLLLYKKIGLTN